MSIKLYLFYAMFVFSTCFGMQQSDSFENVRLQEELVRLQIENVVLRLEQKACTLKKENERQQAILNSQMNYNNVRTGQAIPLQPRINNPQSVKIEEHDIDRTHHVISPEPQ